MTVLKHLDKFVLVCVLLSQLYIITGSEFKTSSSVIRDLKAEVKANKLEFDVREAFVDSTVISTVRSLAVGECLDRPYNQIVKMQLSCDRLFREMGLVYIPNGR